MLNVGCTDARMIKRFGATNSHMVHGHLFGSSASGLLDCFLDDALHEELECFGWPMVEVEDTRSARPDIDKPTIDSKS